MRALFAVTEPFVNAIGRPVARGWARLTGLPGKVIAILLLLAAAGLDIVHLRAKLLDWDPGAWFSIGLTVLVAPLWIRDIERYSDDVDDEVRVLRVTEILFRFLLGWSVLMFVSGVGVVVSSGDGWAMMLSDAAMSLAMMVALAKQGAARSLLAELRARRALRPATVPS